LLTRKRGPRERQRAVDTIDAIDCRADSNVNAVAS
jgi:hypothetical protein